MERLKMKEYKCIYIDSFYASPKMEKNINEFAKQGYEISRTFQSGYSIVILMEKNVSVEKISSDDVIRDAITNSETRSKIKDAINATTKDAIKATTDV